MQDLKKVRRYIMQEINPYGKPFEGSVYEFGLKIMKYIDSVINNEQAYNESVKGDLISRELLIEALNKSDRDARTDADIQGYCDGWNDVVEIINEQPTAYNDGWIPCSERLPDKEGEYIVTLRRWNCVTFANFKDIKNNPHFDTNYVTAWQPLPPAYKPKGE